MEDGNSFIINNKIYSNNYNILINIVKELENISNDLNNNTKLNKIIKQIKDIIILINKVINDNKNNINLIRNDIYNLQKIIINNNNNYINDIKIYNNGKYIGQFKNNLKDGKGIMYWNDGDRYEGDYKNEGKGIYYHNNGDRMMGDYLNGKPIGIHAILRYNGKVESINAAVDIPNGTIQRRWTNGNIDQIAAYVYEQLGSEVPEEIKGYNIETVQFTQAGTFIITFDKAEAFYGDFSLVGEQFEYDLQVEGNSIINGHANGSLKVENGKAIFDVEGKVEDGNSSYSSKITITLVEAK